MSFQSSMREKEADGTGVETKTNGTGNSVLKEDGPKEAAEEEKDRETHEAAHGEETEKKDARPAPERFVTAAEF